MKTVYVRFPNESYSQEMTINWDEFEIVKEFDTEYFGWYHGIYLSITK